MMKLLGPFGPVQARMSVRADGVKFLHCATKGCPWFMDWTTLPLGRALEEVVAHGCRGTWRGFEAYTIRPEKPKGHRL
jgi:hypothetical protein